MTFLDVFSKFPSLSTQDKLVFNVLMHHSDLNSVTF